MDIARLISTANSTVRELKDGEILYREGSTTSSGVYFVLDGQIRMQRGGRHQVLGVFPKGTMFGQSELILGLPRAMTAAADSGGARIVVVDERIFYSEAESNADFLIGLIRFTVRRIIDVLNRAAAVDVHLQAWRLPVPLQALATRNTIENLQLRHYVNNAGKISLRPGAFLFEEGTDTGNHVFVCLEGEVGIHKKVNGRDRLLGKWRGGDFFGYLHLGGDRKRRYSARVDRAGAAFLVFDTELLFRTIRLYPGDFFSLYRTILTHLTMYEINYAEAADQIPN